MTLWKKNLKVKKRKIRTWTDSGKKVQSILGDKNWKECLGYDISQDNIKGKHKQDSNEISLTTPCNLCYILVIKCLSQFLRLVQLQSLNL